MNGIDPVIIERANEIAALMRRGEDLVAACAKLTPAEMEDLEDAVCSGHGWIEIPDRLLKIGRLLIQW